MKDPKSIATFLGQRVAVQDGPSRYKLYILYAILANGLAVVGTSRGALLLVEWSRLESAHMIIDLPDIEVEYL